ncbi:MAG: Ig-like domain-containing protein, partial [Thaumarchaeota archaeon]|nr:Ig-like domain-containing protein [Nitrososphaerota archaeon]
ALEIQFAPPILFSDGSSYQNVVVEAVNSNTSQAAPVMQNTIVNITSSASSIGKVQGFLEIPAGQSYATASFATYGLAGSTTITATASDFVSAQGKLVLVTKAATTLGLYSVPSVVVSDNQTYNNLIVQLHDPSGNPEKTTVPVPVSLQSLNPATGTVPSSVTIPAGSTYATIPLTTTTTTGQIEIAAFATGFQLGKVILNSTLLTLDTTLTPSPEVVLLGGTSNIAIQVGAGNFVVPNATVHWTVTSGLISPASSSTNSTGYSSARVVAQTIASTITVNARITAPGYAPKLATLTLIMNAPPAHPSGILGILLINIIFIPLYMIIIAAGAAGGGVTAFFLIKRRGSYEEVVEGDEL